MNIRKLEKGNKKEIQRFKELPFRLYKGNKFWVPPIPGEIEKIMTPSRHPLYAHSEADFFLVEEDKEILGRIAVLHNRNSSEYRQNKTAFFYYFESVNDLQVSSLLFQAAEEWCRERELDTLTGPRGFLRSSGIGLLVDGFDQLPAVGIPYNFPYYPEMLENLGFSKDHDHFSGFLDRRPDLAIHKIAQKVLARGNFIVKNFENISEIIKWLPKLDVVQQSSFAENPNYYPSSPAEFEFQAKNILSIADPKFIKFILYKDNLAGFIIGHPNISRSLQRSRGQYFPLGWILMLMEKNHPLILDINGVGMLPEYLGLGGNALLYSELEKLTGSTRNKRAEIVQVDERNQRRKSDLERLGVIFSKTHRTYIKSVTT